MMARSVLHLEANSLTEVDRVIVECSAEDLASSLEVWIRRPQVVNKRLLGAVVREESYSERPRENGVPDKLITRQLIPKQSSIQWGWETIQLVDGECVCLIRMLKSLCQPIYSVNWWVVSVSIQYVKEPVSAYINW